MNIKEKKRTAVDSQVRLIRIKETMIKRQNTESKISSRRLEDDRHCEMRVRIIR